MLFGYEDLPAATVVVAVKKYTPHRRVNGGGCVTCGYEDLPATTAVVAVKKYAPHLRVNGGGCVACRSSCLAISLFPYEY